VARYESDDRRSQPSEAARARGRNGRVQIGRRATTAEDGIAAAIRLHPDVVLLDVMLPGMDGYEAARRMAPALPHAMICLMSATDGAIQGDFAARCGATAFVRKQDLRPGLLQTLWQSHARAHAG
jgi:two-component system NarL family response regulator